MNLNSFQPPWLVSQKPMYTYGNLTTFHADRSRSPSHELLIWAQESSHLILCNSNALRSERGCEERDDPPPPAFPHSSTQTQWHPGGLKCHVPQALPFRATFLQISFYWHFLQFNQPWIAFESVERKRGKEMGGGLPPPTLLEKQSQPALFGKMLQ